MLLGELDGAVDTVDWGCWVWINDWDWGEGGWHRPGETGIYNPLHS